MANEGKLIIGILGVGVLSLVTISVSAIDNNRRNRREAKAAKIFKDLLEKSYLENDNLKKMMRDFQKQG